MFEDHGLWTKDHGTFASSGNRIFKIELLK